MSKARGIAFGLSAAVLFGASAPIAKRLLPETGPLLLAACLYLGAGVAITVVRATKWSRQRGRHEASLRRSDLPAIAAVALLGGVLGPVLMMVGMERVSGVTGALLLNLEAPFTMLFAMTLFGEHLGKAELAGAGLIVAGALGLAVGPGAWRGDSLGFLALGAACAAWALDNNVSQRLSDRDPLAVVQAKALSAGVGTLGLAVTIGNATPTTGALVVALLVGAASYGLSLVLDMHALRLLGAAREAAIFATAPFIGAVLSILLLGDRPGPAHALAGVTMAMGVILLARARHGHAHSHVASEHDHLHDHDEHHNHPHDGAIAGPHSHPHRHAPLTHDHPHVSDQHHRHKHD